MKFTSGILEIMIFRCSLNVLLCFVAALSASAATFERTCTDVKDSAFGGPIVCKVELQGNIVRGDAQALRKFLIRSENEDLYNKGVLQLSSNGGDVIEAIRIGNFLKTWYGIAEVKTDATCASACFLIWIGAAGHPGSPRLGLHRPYFPPSSYKNVDAALLSSQQAKVMAQVRNYLQDQNLSQRLIDTMMRRASNDIYWLSEADLKEIGGHAPWFEELLIHECNYDPVGDRIRAQEVLRKKDFSLTELYAPMRAGMQCRDSLLTSRRSVALSKLKQP